MSKSRAILFLSTIFILALSANSVVAQGKFDTTSGGLFGQSATTSQTGVFAAFLSQIPDSRVETAISVSNVLATPDGFQSDFINIGGGDDTGTVELYLYNSDGSLIVYETTSGSPGLGLNEDGTLGPGQTWRVLLGEILDAAGADPVFTGYGWVVANFDGVAGTYNVVIFGLGFTQNFEFTPAVGQGQSFGAGLPVSVP